MSGSSVVSYSPHRPSDVVGEYQTASADDVAKTVALAAEGQRRWWALGAQGRAEALAGAASTLRGRREEAVQLVVREVGKPVGEAAGEVARAISILEFYAQASFAPIGAQFPPSLTGLLYTERRPHGVAGLITPWNFPIAIPLWKAAPALACGNGVVLKASPDAPACAAFLAETLNRHLPENVFTVIHGGAEAGRALVDQADVISFTGSGAAGRLVALAATARGIPVQCEMGGQNAAIVLPDADPVATATLITAAAMGYAGQKCTATRRVIVVGDNTSFIDALTSAVARLDAADPGLRTTITGPVINEEARERVREAITLACDDGGRVAARGGEPGGDGWFLAPTLIDGLSPAHSLAQTETFGPLAIIQYADDPEDAVRLARGVPFGLVTSVHGRDIRQLQRTVDGLDTGLIKVNAPTTGVDFHAPFGGEKASSYGPREQGMAALDFYGYQRTVTLAA
jgi:acyl-CoA reductase-like NAD-dependent aldehyde dehydrogenase